MTTTTHEKLAAAVEQRNRAIRLGELAHLLGVSRSGFLCGEPVTSVYGVGLTQSGLAQLGAVGHCGKVHACPECSAQICRHRREEVTTALEGFYDSDPDQRKRVYLVTLTVRHNHSESAISVRHGIEKGWRALMANHTTKKMRKSGFLHGVIRTIEATYGGNGWHFHIHAVVMLDLERDPYDGRGHHILQRRWLEVWERGTLRKLASGKLGGVPDARYGVKFDLIQKGDLQSLVEYITKMGQTVPKGVAKAAKVQQKQEFRAHASEVTYGANKKGRAGNRSPFEVLDNMVSILESANVDFDHVRACMIAAWYRLAAENGEDAALGGAWRLSMPERAKILLRGVADEGKCAEFWRDLKIWSEWAAASHGMRAYTWSRGLKDLYLIDEVDDAAAATLEDSAMMESERLLGGIDATILMDKRTFLPRVEAVTAGCDTWGAAREAVRALLAEKGIALVDAEVVRAEWESYMEHQRVMAWLSRHERNFDELQEEDFALAESVREFVVAHEACRSLDPEVTPVQVMVDLVHIAQKPPGYGIAHLPVKKQNAIRWERAWGQENGLTRRLFDLS
ncbi:hypothetical protein CRD17_01355 [Corynebacterium sp. LK30]|uniref:protein rep n=1 Tax=Corynebacterium sp. LK30 TaxID=2044577 RepID=UPI001652B644|nr:protein rep [Corynebacterium sp. LK30]MBC6805864.1 hypothetical protein [Corynebacterium sp. LK30]